MLSDHLKRGAAEIFMRKRSDAAKFIAVDMTGIRLVEIREVRVLQAMCRQLRNRTSQATTFLCCFQLAGRCTKLLAESCGCNF